MWANLLRAQRNNILCLHSAYSISAFAGPRGRLHITETDAADTDAFAAAFPTGVAMRAVSVGLVSDHDGRRAAVQELTARQEALDSAEKGQPVKAKLSFDAVTPGRSVSGCALVPMFMRWHTMRSLCWT